MPLLSWLRAIPQRRKAHQSARLAAAHLEPHEPIFSSYIVADEPERLVVRVFVGSREQGEVPLKLPPWKLCLVFGVSKSSFEARLELDPKYQPTLR